LKRRVFLLTYGITKFNNKRNTPNISDDVIRFLSLLKLLILYYIRPNSKRFRHLIDSCGNDKWYHWQLILPITDYSFQAGQ